MLSLVYLAASSAPSPYLNQCWNIVNSLRLRQNGRHFPDDIFKYIFLNENVWISIKILLKFVPMSPIYNISSLVQIMAYADQATSHYLNQWWLVYWRIHASLGLNELIQTLGTSFIVIVSKIHAFSFKKVPLKMLSAKWRQFLLGLNMLIRPLAANLSEILLNVLKSKLRGLKCWLTANVNCGLHPPLVDNTDLLGKCGLPSATNMIKGLHSFCK